MGLGQWALNWEQAGSQTFGRRQLDMLQDIWFISGTNWFYICKSEMDYHGFLAWLLHSNWVGSSLCTLQSPVLQPSPNTIPKGRAKVRHWNAKNVAWELICLSSKSLEWNAPTWFAREWNCVASNDWNDLLLSTYSADFDVACFQTNLFDKTVFHEFVAQAQNGRWWKKNDAVVLLLDLPLGT